MLRRFQSLLSSSKCVQMFLLTIGFIVFYHLFFKQAKLLKNTNQLEFFQNDQINAQLCPGWIDITKQAKQCMYNLLTPPYWLSLSPAVVNCSTDWLMRALNVHLLSNKEDGKGFIDYRDVGRYADQCNALTLGVGGDILAEEKLLTRLPKCKMYGADPILQSGIIFKKIGQYFPFAVSSKSGMIKASVLLDPEQIYNYEKREVETISLVELLNQIDVKIIDFLFVDIEGGEYELLEVFNRPNGGVIKEGIVICQLSMEIHGPMEQYGVKDDQEWLEILKRFIEHSDFLPIWLPRPSVNFRSFFINTKSQSCIDKFYGQFCNRSYSSLEYLQVT